jgi:hypothetical protein
MNKEQLFDAGLTDRTARERRNGNVASTHQRSCQRRSHPDDLTDVRGGAWAALSGSLLVSPCLRDGAPRRRRCAWCSATSAAADWRGTEHSRK